MWVFNFLGIEVMHGCIKLASKLQTQACFICSQVLPFNWEFILGFIFLFYISYYMCHY